MDIYARAGMLDQVEALFDSSPDPDVVRCGVLIKAYGNCDRADRATDIVHHFLKPDNTVAPNIDIFTSLIDAWAESSRGDAVEQACAVIKLMEENERCRSLGIRPCVVTFSALLKCISESKAASTASDISCQHVESILDTMESRYMAGETNVKPNQISYTLAMKTCFRAGNLAKADAIMKRMEQSDTPPDIRTYSEILQHYSQMATPAAAKRTEQILSYMTELSRSMPSLKPNMYSYSIAMNAWALSGDPDSANRMWKIFERTKQEGLAMDIVFSTALITFLSKIKQRKAMQRAWSVLQEIENGTVHADHRPNARQYMAVIQGFVQAGDAENATLVLLRLVEVYVNSGVPNANKSTLPRDDIDFAFDNNNTTQSWGNSIPEQKKKSHDSGYEPRPSMFHAVALAWIRKGNLIKATALLDKMVELASDTASTSTTTNTNTANSENPGGEDAIRTTAAIVASPSMIPHGPDVGTYNVLLRHWLASSHPDKDVYATKIRNHIDAWHQTRYRSSSSSVNNDLG